MDIKPYHEQQVIDYLHAGDFKSAFELLQIYTPANSNEDLWLQQVRREYLSAKEESELTLLRTKIIRYVNSRQPQKIIEDMPTITQQVQHVTESPITFAALTIISIGFGLWGELIPSSFSDYLKDRLGNYYTPVWVLTGIFFFVGTIVLSIKKKQRKKTSSPEVGRLSAEQRAQFVHLLQNRYKSRLDQKMDERFALKLELRYTLADIPYSELLDPAAKSERDIQEKLLALLEKHHYLLILGEPGAGKTCELLNLAQSLLVNAKKNEHSPIPVIFNLANWKDSEEPFANWMTTILIQGYGYPKGLARKAIQNNSIIPLFDGLDEVGNSLDKSQEKIALRNQCLAAIDEYEKQKNTPEKLIICCRLEEYKQMATNAPVYAQVLVKPLAHEQIKEKLELIKGSSDNLPYKAANREAASNLLHLINQYPALNEVLCTPFYFNAAMQVLHNPEDRSLSLGKDVTTIKSSLLSTYINRKLQFNPHSKYTPDEIKKWLGWLARWQSKRSNSSFELADFQLKDLNNDLLFKWGLALVSGMIIGLGFGWVCGLLAFFINRQRDRIKVYQPSRWELRRFSTRKHLGQTLKVVGSNILGFSFLAGSFAFFAWGNWEGFLRGLLIGSIGGGVFSLLLSVKKEIYFTEISHPLQRIKAGFWDRLLNLIILFSLFALVILYEDLTLTNIMLSLLIGFSEGIIITFIYSAKNLHSVLNYILARENKLPFRMVPFFEHCTILRLLEKDSGGTWRFRHQIIQTYFLASYLVHNLRWRSPK